MRRAKLRFHCTCGAWLTRKPRRVSLGGFIWRKELGLCTTCGQSAKGPILSRLVIRDIVGRCHVGESNRAVIRYVISRLRLGYQTWRGLPRAERRDVLAYIIQEHADNRALYVAVTTGRIGDNATR